MDNPFLKRATELYRDDEAFLAVVSPEPVSSYLGQAGKDGRLYDRLVLLQGTPGSGKTTIARLFEFRTISALLKNSQSDYYKTLAAALSHCGALVEGKPTVVGCRLPLESDYREIWEFPYSDTLKTGLTTALIQCRAVLSWFRNLSDAGIPIESIELVTKENSVGGIEAIGGTVGADVLRQAQVVEAALYKIIAALVPPEELSSDDTTTVAYRPFDVIRNFRIKFPDGQTRELQPLLILDDANILHPNQYKNIHHWMVRRELAVARWILTRLDVMQPEEVLETQAVTSDPPVELAGITADRDTCPINLQGGNKDRKKSRGGFRKLGKDISNRYLRKMPIFESRNLSSLSDLLSDTETSITKSQKDELVKSLKSIQKKLSVSDKQREKLEEKIKKFRSELPIDVQLGMLAIMMHRHNIRLSENQKSLFPDDEAEPSKPVNANTDVIEAARLHLFHKFERPYYFGIDDLCDASSENVEQFLRLAASLVNASANNIIRSKSPTLDTKTQTKLLGQRATQAIGEWDYPHCKAIERMTGAIADKCKSVSLKGNAPLGAGANAYGIPQAEFNVLAKKFPDLARILQFAISYNAISLAPNLDCKKKTWCLLELGGMVILKYGLTLKRGGFIEGNVEELTSFLSTGEQ